MCRPRRAKTRRGTTSVEVAVVLPVFFLFLFGVIETGRAIWVNNMLREATRAAARTGAINGVTSAQIQQAVRDVLSSTLDAQKVQVTVKNAEAYDNSGSTPETFAEFNALPNIELGSAQSRQLFIVRATIGYNDVALLRMPFMNGVTLGGHTLKRHE